MDIYHINWFSRRISFSINSYEANQPGFTHKSGRPVTFCQTWAAEDRWNGEAIGMENSTWRTRKWLITVVNKSPN